MTFYPLDSKNLLYIYQKLGDKKVNGILYSLLIILRYQLDRYQQKSRAVNVL